MNILMTPPSPNPVHIVCEWPQIENAINELTDTIVEKMADDAVNERTNSNGNMSNINPNEDDEESGIIVY